MPATSAPCRPTPRPTHLLPPGSRWGEGAHSVLELLLHDRTAKPDAFSEGHPSAPRQQPRFS